MPPPKGSVGADGQGQQMAFRRAKSTGGNATAEQARAALVRAFEAADLDRSGMIGPYRARPLSTYSLRLVARSVHFLPCSSLLERLVWF